jgi:hypothetical protein
VTRETRNMMRTAVQRFVAITDPEIFHYKDLSDAIPGFIQQMDDTHGRENWHFIALMLQWSQGQVTIRLMPCRNPCIYGQLPSGAPRASPRTHALHTS